MHETFLTYDKWQGVIPMLAGIYALLLAYKVIPIKSGNPAYSESWHKKYGQMMKILGPIGITGGIVSFLLVFSK